MSFAVWILASVFVAAGANKCDVSHMQKCIGPLSGSQMDFNKPEQACKTLGDVKTCLEAMKGRCPGLRASIDSGLAGVNQQYSTYCSTTGCSAVKFMKCQNMLPNLKSEGAPTKENCESLSKAIKCFEQVLLTCPEGTEKKMNTQQLNQLKMMFQMCSPRTPGGAGPTSGSPRTPGGAGPTSGS
ncbi:unnamed protein product [Lymnaea stagnalis]|uniref:Secreted protein n=1 Tax=Lymnaea stagnalis TaxID=6523 RepID=A0AAV2IDI5_LYMST